MDTRLLWSSEANVLFQLVYSKAVPRCVPFVNAEQGDTTKKRSTWERTVDLLNLRDLVKIIREPGFWAGIIVRTATLIGVLLFLNYGGDITDMNELVYKGLLNLLQGIYPYGQSYHLTTFGGPFIQDYFNYPPFSMIFHLPTFLWVGPQSIGTIDFMPGFFMLHTFFDFVTYYRLWQEDRRISSKIIWINPFFVMVNIITFLSLPLMFLTLALLNLNKPIRSGFYSMLVASTYQMGAIFLPFILVYQFRQKELRNTLLGMLPIIIVGFLFFLWNPFLFIRDLVIMQIGRPSVNWFDSTPTSHFYNRYYPATFLFYGSIPSIIFNFAIILGIPPDAAPQIAPTMMILVIGFAIVFLIYFIYHPRPDFAILFPGVLLALFIGSTAEGLAHYWVLTITLPFLFWHERRTFKISETSSSSKPSVPQSTSKQTKIEGNIRGEDNGD